MVTTSDFAAAMSALFSILSHRLLTFIALGMTFGLFCWAMYMGDSPRFFAAGGFGIVVFWPVLLRDSKKESSRADPENQ